MSDKPRKTRRVRKHIGAPKLAVGTAIKHRDRGVGIVKAIDPANPDFFYLLDFRGAEGDGSLVWLSKWKAEKCPLNS